MEFWIIFVGGVDQATAARCDDCHHGRGQHLRQQERPVRQRRQPRRRARYEARRESARRTVGGVQRGPGDVRPAVAVGDDRASQRRAERAGAVVHEGVLLRRSIDCGRVCVCDCELHSRFAVDQGPGDVSRRVRRNARAGARQRDAQEDDRPGVHDLLRLHAGQRVQVVATGGRVSIRARRSTTSSLCRWRTTCAWPTCSPSPTGTCACRCT